MQKGASSWIFYCSIIYMTITFIMVLCSTYFLKLFLLQFFSRFCFIVNLAQFLLHHGHTSLMDEEDYHNYYERAISLISITAPLWTVFLPFSLLLKQALVECMIRSPNYTMPEVLTMGCTVLPLCELMLMRRISVI